MAVGSKTLTALASSAAATDVALVTAIPNARIAVVALTLSTGASGCVVTFNSKPAGAGSAISGTFTMAANGGFVLPKTEDYFRTNLGEGLTFTVTGAGTASVTCVYRITY